MGLYSQLSITVSIKRILPSLPCTGVVVPLPAAALQLPLQPGQSLQPPMDVVSRWEVAWHRAEASLEADVLEIVQCRFPRGKRQLGAQQYRRLVAGAGLEHVVWLGSFLLEAGESSLPLLFAAPVGSGLDRELGLTEFGHCVLPHKFCTFHALCVAVTAAAAGISRLQDIEGLTLATKVGVARLWQVPRAIHHMLTSRQADLVQIVWRRPPRREAIQPVAPAPLGSASLAVLG